MYIEKFLFNNEKVFIWNFFTDSSPQNPAESIKYKKKS